jgi:small GTP-binding protein
MLATSIIQKKICLLGDFSTGKTSLVRRFVYNVFDERYMSTLGVNISRKVVDLSAEQWVHLMIWDLSGNEKFDGARSEYIRGASGAFLVGDLSREDTIAKLPLFRDFFYETNPDVPIIVIGNKSDLVPENSEIIEQVHEIANGFNAPCKITSAKTGDEVQSAFSQLAQLLVNFHNGS